MPISEIEKLAGDSESPQTKAALSSCIAEEIQKGIEPEEAKAICMAMIQDKTGQGI